MKVVINDCFGGFSLSERAIRLYADRKGITLYPEEGMLGLVTYWTVPAQERPKPLEGPRQSYSLEERAAWNKAYSESRLYDRDIPRDDADLIAVVEALGKAANGRCASLKVVEIPDDVEWQINKCDGNELVAYKHRRWE